MRLRTSPQSNARGQIAFGDDITASMRLRTSPQSNAPAAGPAVHSSRSFNEAADFAAEQRRPIVPRRQRLVCFNEAADFAAEQPVGL